MPSKHSRLLPASVLLAGLLLTPLALQAQALAQPRDTILLTKPTLLAFILINPATIDSEPSGDLATVADDFSYYLGTLVPLFDSLGIRLAQTLDSTIALVNGRGRVTSFGVLGPDSILVGYWLLGGGREPKYLGGGVRTDVDLVPAVCNYCGIQVPQAYR